MNDAIEIYKGSVILPAVHEVHAILPAVHINPDSRLTVIDPPESLCWTFSSA